MSNAERVAVPRRSAVVRIVWRDDKGKAGRERLKGRGESLLTRRGLTPTLRV